MKYLPREIAFAKLNSMVAGAIIVRREVEFANPSTDIIQASTA